MDLREAGRSALRKLYFQLHWMIGDGTRLLDRVRKNNWLISLNLHRVSTDVNPFYPPLHPKLFEELVKFLDKHFEITTYDRLSERKSGKPAIVLSFDDGYHDFLEYAVPILDRFNVRANQNVVCSCLVSGKPIWNVQLYDFLTQAPATLLSELRVAGWKGDFKGGASQRSQSGTALSRVLKNLPRRERLQQWGEVEALMKRCEGLQLTRVLNPAQVIELSRRHSIGVHSFDHDSMALENDDFFARDVLRCREFFSEQLRLPLNVYAFPNGSYRAQQIQHLRSSGFEHALLVDEQYGEMGAPAQPRLTFYGSSNVELRLRSLGYFAAGARCES